MSSINILGWVVRAAVNSFLLSGTALLVQLPALATQSVTLQWNPSTGSFVAGYQVYYGGASGNYTNTLSTGNATKITVSGLIEGATYYFAVAAFDSLGFQSQLSSEVSYFIPTNGVTINRPTNQLVTVDGTASFSVTTGGTPPSSYQWSFNGTNIMCATNSTLTINDVELSQAGNYAVLVTDSNGSILISNVVLTVVMVPIITGQPASQSVLLGCDATFNVSACGTGPLNYQWWTDGLALNGQTNLSLTLTNVQTSDFGNYCVVVTNVFGSITSSPAQLALGQPPVANPDTVYRFASGGVRINASVLLANDTVAMWDSLAIIGVSPNSAEGGTVSLTNNWVYYAPPRSTTNEDNFTYMVSDGHCGTDVGTVTVQIKADNPQPLALAIIDPGDGSIRLTFDGIPGHNYRIEHTDSLSNQNWQILGTQTADGLGVCQFVDGSLTNAPAQFYRAVSP
jgi:hypothetical protein